VPILTRRVPGPSPEERTDEDSAMCVEFFAVWLLMGIRMAVRKTPSADCKFYKPRGVSTDQEVTMHEEIAGERI
jgi:hypothetical protein